MSMRPRLHLDASLVTKGPGLLAIALLAIAPMSREPLWPVVGATALATIAVFGVRAVCPVLVLLVTFLPEHSQTRWGVRSAADLATFYNTRALMALPVSIFDIVVTGSCLAWIGASTVLDGAGWRRVLPGARLRGAVALASGSVLVGVILGGLGVAHGADPYHLLRELRPLLYFLVLLVLASDLLGRPGRVKELAVIAAGGMALHGVEGIMRSVLGNGRATSGRLMIYFDFSDSLALAFGLCLVAAWWAGRCRSELWNTAAVVAGAAVMGFSFVFSFRRSFWLGLAAGLAVLAWRAPWSERRRLAALAAASVLGIAVVIGGVRAVQPLVAATPAGALDSQVRAVGQRVASIANTTSEPTNRFRVFDTLNATNAVLKSSGLGAGFGSRYDVVWSDEQQREFLEHVSRLSHNTYLYLAMKMGVLGLIAWAWLFCELLVQVLASRAGSSMRAVTEAVAATLVTAGVAALFMPLAYNVRPMVLLALTCGLGLAAARDVESVG